MSVKYSQDKKPGVYKENIRGNLLVNKLNNKLILIFNN